MLAPSDCNRFEACVDVERPQHGVDVVADGLGAELELGRDLFGGAAVLEQAQHLALAWRQLWVRGPRQS